MVWTPEDVARERPDLQALATYKYDEYQQFSPGMRFVESLASWLSQFRTLEERRTAYDFVKSNLIFCSSAEMNHLVSIAYPDHIRPLLLQKAAQDAGINEYFVSKLAGSTEFKMRQRQCLFLGLSDGALIDVFRRSNSPELSHEQILQTYEVTHERVEELIKKLSESLAALLGQDPPEDMRRFRTIVLLDDFSGSGISYLRRDDSSTFEGKIGRFYRNLTNVGNPTSRLIDIKRVEVLVVLYMATDRARLHLEMLSKKMWSPLNVEHSVVVVHPLSSVICVHPEDRNAIVKLIETYYDATLEDQHTKLGGEDVKYGFARCGLPLVLSHNTPNNSLCLLWGESERMRALFPRVSRHRKEA
jgi:hypothetical protein